jgi:hypothetical protein
LPSREPWDKLLSYAGIVIMLLPLLVIGPMIYNFATGSPRPTAMMPLLFLVYPLVMILAWSPAGDSSGGRRRRTCG